MLKMLEDPMIIKKIEFIIDNKLGQKTVVADKRSNNSLFDYGVKENKDKSITLQLSVLRGEKEELLQRNEILNEDNKLLKAKIQELDMELVSLRKQKRDIEGRCQELTHGIEEKERRLKQFQEKTHSLEQDLDALSQYNENLLKKQETLVKSLEEEKVDNDNNKKLLKQRFDEGWKVYEQYRKLPEDIRDNLKFYFARPKFESFIFGGADKGLLDDLWNETRDCIKYERQEEAVVLWKMFEYFLGLANLTYEEDRYQIVNVDSVYDQEYDYSKHQLDARSVVQGLVDDVIIPGYYYQGELKKKTIVVLREA